MEPDTADLPPSYKDAIQDGTKIVETDSLPPAVLLLEGDSIKCESSSTLLYQLSRNITSLPRTPPKNSSVVFERVEQNALEKTDATTQPQQHHHLFYLAHPADAQYRTDVPGYYITSVDSSATIGNMHFETTKSRLQKTEFTALLSAGRTCAHKPLFDALGKSVTLFNARPAGWMSSRYVWTDGEGRQVAVEDVLGKNDRGKTRLSITMSMKQEERDALVALWVLRLWYETAESKQAKKEAMERMTPPTLYQDLTMVKRTGALGAIGGAGGC
ncbi:uncharacterized protein BDV17DRAFT_191789 [Aspergillus undulatus]|uniref:uncharacterized protein n=1 Tax=Aspergillus undulatus TaxID=1810928 RepID=UPI003CCCCEA6